MQVISDNLLYSATVFNTGSSGGGGGSSTDGSDTFEAQLILDNVVNSGTKKTESAVVNETVAVLKEILGDK
jgi:hypothetical protein